MAEPAAAQMSDYPVSEPMRPAATPLFNCLLGVDVACRPLIPAPPLGVDPPLAPPLRIIIGQKVTVGG